MFSIFLFIYLFFFRPLTFEKRKVKEQAKRPLPPPPEVNKKVVDALNKMLNFSFTVSLIKLDVTIYI